MILINGRQQDQISIRDRALHYGDGVFETFAVRDGEVLAWDRHIARLQLGCGRLAIECPDTSLLRSEATRLLDKRRRGVLKLIISRGEGGRGYQPPQPAQTTRVFSLHEWPDYPVEYAQHGINATICNMRLGHNPVLAGMKHLNRLEQVLLRQELSTTGFPEAIVMDLDDWVIEGTMSNVFLVKDGKLQSPDLIKAGVAGIIRGRILESAETLGLSRAVGGLTLDDVLAAEEVFFCNSVAGIWPVARINQTSYKVGPYSRRFQQQLVDENLIMMS